VTEIGGGASGGGGVVGVLKQAKATNRGNQSRLCHCSIWQRTRWRAPAHCRTQSSQRQQPGRFGFDHGRGYGCGYGCDYGCGSSFGHDQQTTTASEIWTAVRPALILP
jgi:hypothetical protein